MALGASAGGLEAFRLFLKAVDPGTGMAFVLIQHFAPHHRTLMPDLMARETALPVRQARDGMAIEPGHVYVVPADVAPSLDGCRFRLGRARGARRRLPIDEFFKSLASEQGHNAVAVVLSGTGTDGAAGARQVKEHGGLVMVQSPATAKHEEMPRAVMGATRVDRVLAPEDMPALLEQHARRLTDFLRAPPATPEGALAEICRLLHRRTGHDFSRYKKGTLERRIHRRMLLRARGTLEAYLELLREDGDEAQALFEDLLIGVTHFFRDPAAWQALETQVIAPLLEGRGKDRPVRAWVPGCASGEEAYGLAMLLTEAAGRQPEPPPVQVFATDIADRALQTARQGRYPASIAQEVPAHRLERFFRRHAGTYQVQKALRDCCLFSVHDLLRDPPFTRLDLISCRNTLIYLDADVQKRVLQLFHFALAPGGLLFLGPSESAPTQTRLFRTLDKKARLFVRRERLDRPLVLPSLGGGGGARRARLPGLPAGSAAGQEARFDRMLLESLAPPGVVVNEQGEVLHFGGRTGPYLEPPPGMPNLSVTEMARPGLRLPIRAALHKAVRTRQTSVREGVAFEGAVGPARVDVIVRPLVTGGEEGLFAVAFRDHDGEGAPPPPVEDPIAQQLESELSATREYLQATIEELESANEELQTSNEELLSTNEELQTSKEELQSVNEEFEAVNAELSRKVEELDRAHSDLLNLFQSTRIATVFLDRELRVKRFTPAATEIFRLIEGDLGRPIGDIASRLAEADGDLERDVRRTLESLAAVERPVRLGDGRSFVLRVLPYRTLDDVIDGVVLTFSDVTELVHAHAQERRLAAIVQGSDDAIFSKDLQFYLTSWNPGAERLYGWTEAEVLGRHVSFIVPPERLEELQRIERTIQQGRRVDTFETIRVRRDGRRLHVSITVSPIFGEGGEVTGASVIARDVTARRQAEEAVRKSERELADFFENASVGLHWVGPDGTILRVNRAELEMMGYSREEYVGRNIAEFHVDEPVISGLLDRLTRGEVVRDCRARLRTKSGGIRHALIDSSALFEDGRFLHTRSFTRDVTDQVRAETALREEARRKDEFLAVLSHELRNPLAPIRNALDVLGTPGLADQRAARARTMMDRQLRHLSRLVDDLLDLSRLSRDKIELRKEPLDLVQVAREVVEDLRSSIEQAGVAFEAALPDSVVVVEGDATRLAQVVGNLLRNACKFTNPGGTIRLEIGRERGMAAVAVADTGIGLAPAMLAVVFEPFTQAETGPARTRGGLGLGLALVRALVELHGGRVEAQSPGLGQGSTFRVRLPLSPLPIPVASAPAAVDGQASRRVLVVEDNLDAAESLALVLQFAGHVVEVAHDAASGLEKARDFRPEVVLCDIGLPGEMTGYDVARALRAEPGLEGCYLIALTGYAQAEDVAKGKEAGFDVHLKKPADPAAVRELLQGWRPGTPQM